MIEDTVRPEARPPRGFRDKRLRDVEAEQLITRRITRSYELFGFEPLETPALEYADALGKFLPDKDRPNTGVFALRDEDGQWLALRYDHTAPLARYVAENWSNLPRPFRRYTIGPVWRNEKPGPGRFREFIQCDADIVGSARPEADAEILALAVSALTRAGVARSHFAVKVNSRNLLDGLFESLRMTNASQRLKALRAVDKYDRLGWRGVRDLLGPGRMDESGDFTSGAGLGARTIERFHEFLEAKSGGRAETLGRLHRAVRGSETSDRAIRELDDIHAALCRMDIGDRQIRFDPTVVRGLEYYTGPVFEADFLLPTYDEAGDPVRFGSIGGGGRYDDLVARFTGERVPATGFSFGISRLVAARNASRLRAEKQRSAPVVILVLSASLLPEYFTMAAELRRFSVPVEVYLGHSGMKAQMKYADRRGSPAVVLFGEDELASGTVTIKDLDLGRELARAVTDNSVWRESRPGQLRVPRSELVHAVRSILRRRGSGA